MDVARLRSQIPACERTIYLNTGWSGPSPLPVVEAIQQRVAMESRDGPTTAPVVESARQLVQHARQTLAGMVNVTPDEVLLTQNTTEGLNIVLNGLDWRPGDELITVSIEYPSVMVLALHIRERYGVNIRVVPMEHDEGWASIVAKLKAAITPKTRLLFLSHVHYLNGLRMPVEELRRITRERGVRLLLDGAQCLAHIQLDLRALDVDYYAMPAQKWLCGPAGCGALYIRKDLIPSLSPTFVCSRAAKAYDSAGNYEPDTGSILKFQLTTSSVALQAGMEAATKFIQGVGVPAVERRDAELAGAMKRALRKVPDVTVLSPERPPEATGLVTFSVDGWDPQKLVTALWEAKRIVSRPVTPLGGVRFSLHFFNTEEEVATAAEAVRALAR